MGLFPNHTSSPRLLGRTFPVQANPANQFVAVALESGKLRLELIDRQVGGVEFALQFRQHDVVLGRRLDVRRRGVASLGVPPLRQYLRPPPLARRDVIVSNAVQVQLLRA